MADDDNQPEEVQDERTDENAFQKEFKARETKVRQLQGQGKLKEALVSSLENPPLGTKNDTLKDQSADLVSGVISAIKAADIKSHVEALNDDQLDLLLKYIYRAMATSDQKSDALLIWHASIVDKTGIGSIVRAFAERRTV